MRSMQSYVEEEYRAVINKTIEALRRDFQETGLRRGAKYLEAMKKRWIENLNAMADFTEDPEYISTPSPPQKEEKHCEVVSTRAGSRERRTQRPAVESVGCASSRPSDRVGFSDITNDPGFEGSRSKKRGREDLTPNRVASLVKRTRGRENVGSNPAASLIKREQGTEDAGRNSAALPAGRPRHKESEDEGATLAEMKSTLSSSDEGDPDTQVATEEDKAQLFDHYVLADCSEARANVADGKFKITMKEGVACLNGREYLFSRALCVFDW